MLRARIASSRRGRREEHLNRTFFCGIEWAEGHHDTAVVDAGRSLLAARPRRTTPACHALADSPAPSGTRRRDQQRPTSVHRKTSILKAYAGIAPPVPRSKRRRSIGMASRSHRHQLPRPLTAWGLPGSAPDCCSFLSQTTAFREVRVLPAAVLLQASGRTHGCESFAPVGRVASEARSRAALSHRRYLGGRNHLRRCRRPRRQKVCDALTASPQSAGPAAPRERRYLDSAVPPSDAPRTRVRFRRAGSSRRWPICGLVLEGCRRRTGSGSATIPRRAPPTPAPAVERVASASSVYSGHRRGAVPVHTKPA